MLGQLISYIVYELQYCSLAHKPIGIQNYVTVRRRPYMKGHPMCGLFAIVELPTAQPSIRTYFNSTAAEMV
jgi:hypothetical protein